MGNNKQKVVSETASFYWAQRGRRYQNLEKTASLSKAPSFNRGMQPIIGDLRGGFKKLSPLRSFALHLKPQGGIRFIWNLIGANQTSTRIWIKVRDVDLERP